MAKNRLNPAKDIPKRDKVTNYPEYWKFVGWIATPTPLRNLKTQRDLAKELQVHEVTLSVWKSVEGFRDDVRRKIKEWAGDDTPNVIRGLRRKAIQDGTAAEVKLWLQWVDDWVPKEETKHSGTVETELSEESKKLISQALDYVADRNKEKNN